MEIIRQIQNKILNRLQSSNKIIIIYGARQTGKTTLANKIIQELNLKTIKINAEEQLYNQQFSRRDLELMKQVVGDHQCLFIDEAQKIDDIGINLKILHDAYPNLKIIVTGSSSFDLANKVSEPLTGRHWTFKLFPISIQELRSTRTDFDIGRNLNQYLLYGSYPEVILNQDNEIKQNYLRQISSDYLYRDALELVDIKNSSKVRDLLKLLALQVGSNVSFNELSNKLGIAKSTIERYVDLLEKNFVIYRLTGFSRNLRKEINQQPKIYFNDLGIRNALINDFKDLDLRLDVGGLWENFLINERIKLNEYTGKSYTPYFWRTYTGAEIDYVEDTNGELNGYEFKFTQSNRSAPKTWLQEYENASWTLINQNNWMSFVS